MKALNPRSLLFTLQQMPIFIWFYMHAYTYRTTSHIHKHIKIDASALHTCTHIYIHAWQCVRARASIQYVQVAFIPTVSYVNGLKRPVELLQLQLQHLRKQSQILQLGIIQWGICSIFSPLYFFMVLINVQKVCVYTLYRLFCIWVFSYCFCFCSALVA